MYKHILLPYDGSEPSSNALKEATAFAKSIGASLTLVHVVLPFHLHVQAWATSKEVINKIEEGHVDEAKAAARAKLSEIEARAKAGGIRCDSVVAVDDFPYRAIIDTATKSGCDLIMMASHGRRGIDAVMLGSETAKVLAHSRIPVLVVH
jgi:nucleotide-binding universal stress UspA family protein